MKRWICFLLGLAALVFACGALAADNSYGVTFHAVDAERISVEMPDGLAADVQTEDGILRVVIDDAATDWERVLSSGGGYPHVTIRPTIQKPNDMVTGHYGFNGGINSVTQDYIIEFLEKDIASNENDHLAWSNGEVIGEIVADRSLFIPRSDGNPEHSPDTWGGTVICWVSKDDPDYRYYEKAVFSISHKSDENIHVPLRFVPAAMLAPTADQALPANVELTKLENGEVTFTVTSASDSNERLSVLLAAPEGAVNAAIIHEGGHHEELNIVGGNARIEDIDFNNISRVDERQYTVVWYDENGEMLDYGLLWVHVIPPENDPWACYADGWYPVDESRVVINNGADGCGVEVSYAPQTGVAHIGYDNSVNITTEPGNVGIYVLPPEGAVCYRENHSGGNVIMGRDDWMVSEQAAVVQMQDYRVLEDGEMLCIRDHTPMREVQAGPVTVYIQDGDVWPYGGGVSLIYWYDSIEAAVETPDQPMRIEYICDTNDVLCQVKRTSLVDTEEEITEPVTEITAIGDYDWKLVVKRYPQKGSNAFHWDLQLENETGVYQPLNGTMVFYVPYPKGHDNHTEYFYELRHYDDEHNNFTLVDARRTEFGLRFEVSSLSPFVMSWEEADVSNHILTLPASLKTIRSEAFTGMYLGKVILPEGIERIEDRAFADCSLMFAITLPGSLQYIADDAFTGCTNMVATVSGGSYTHDWCVEHQINIIVE